MTSPVCDAGYTIVGGSCAEGNVAVLTDVQILGNAWYCEFDVDGVVTAIQSRPLLSHERGKRQQSHPVRSDGPTAGRRGLDGVGVGRSEPAARPMAAVS